jgi:hypothetical protein
MNISFHRAEELEYEWRPSVSKMVKSFIDEIEESPNESILIIECYTG